MKFSFLFIISLLTLFLYPKVLVAQDYYIVTGRVVNVRSGPGENYEVLGAYEKGSEIKVHEITNSWAKIILSNSQYGYISVNYIVKQQTSTNNADIEDDKGNELSEYKVALCLILVICFVWVFYQLNRRCSKCGKWNAIRQVNKELVGTQGSSIRKVERHTDIKGNEHTNTYYVPATNYTYKIYKRCRRCGYSYSNTMTEKNEN